ncbi:MAG TPA: SDR family NAD(P)-dependent oxidoreductase [Burkholderiales bacterium]|nr:SDR family NAD(P)-dependent oxidoreductase [Burkholderiales bacterium]
MSEFAGRVVLVTGCARARGIGRAIAVAFARAGADVVVTDVAAGGTRNENEEGLEEIRLVWKGLDSLAGEIKSLGRRVLTLVGDVSRAADAERFVADALAQLGRIDVLVNNAAAPHGADRRLLWEIPEEAWDLVIDVNLKGTFLMSRAVIPHMLERGSGRIISMASVSGKRGTARRGAYTASKFGVIGLTQVMAQELGAHGITVNAICPGSVDTSRRESTSRRERALAERDPNAAVLSLPPTGRVARPDDIARLALFFASEASDHITGQAWNVDGGTVMH